MKRGLKRSAFSDSADDASASPLTSKRVMDAPTFDVHRAESSHQHVMAGPALDVQRAEAARRHVRALNSQFVSWVQLQLQNHQDELWEDGVRDYLSHASDIMEKFKDVVDWLRASMEKPGIASASSSLGNQKTLLSLPEKNNVVLEPSITNGLAKAVTLASSSISQNTGSQNLFPSSVTQIAPASGSSSSESLLANNNKPLLANNWTKPPVPTVFSFSGKQNSGAQSLSQFPTNQPLAFPGAPNYTSLKVEASEDVDEETEPEQPSSPSLQKAEEIGVVVIHEAKCKVYVKADNAAEKAWKDIGIGHLSIKCKEGAQKATKESKPTIVIRNDVGKILLNALIYCGIKMNIQKNTVTSIFHTSDVEQTEAGKSSVVARTYLLRLKNEEEATKLAAAIRESAPSD